MNYIRNVVGNPTSIINKPIFPRWNCVPSKTHNLGIVQTILLLANGVNLEGNKLRVMNASHINKLETATEIRLTL